MALALFGMNPADSGKILVEGKEVSIRSVKDAVQAGIGYVPEDRLEQGLFMKSQLAKILLLLLLIF